MKKNNKNNICSIDCSLSINRSDISGRMVVVAECETNRRLSAAPFAFKEYYAGRFF